MEKYYIVKTITIDLNDGKGEKIHRHFEHLVTLYDDYNEAYNKILKNITERIDDEDDKYDMGKDEISAQFLKRSFDFTINLSPSKTKQATKYHFKKLKNGIFEEIESDIKLQFTTTIESIEKGNELFTLIESDFVDGKFKSYKKGIFEDSENMAVCLANYNTFRKLNDEEEPYLSTCILDKTKIYDDEYICMQMVKEGFLEGFDRSAVNTLSYFNPEMLNKCMLEIRKEIILKNQEEKRLKKQGKEEKENLLRQIDDLKEENEKLEKTIKKKDKKLKKLKRIMET